MRRDLLGDALGVLLDIRFPVTKDQPPLSFERRRYTAIARHVRGDLRDPVPGIVSSLELGEASLEIAAVPVVAIAEDDDVCPPKYQVGLAKDAVASGARPNPKLKERAPELHFAARP